MRRPESINRGNGAEKEFLFDFHIPHPDLCAHTTGTRKMILICMPDTSPNAERVRHPRTQACWGQRRPQPNLLDKATATMLVYLVYGKPAGPLVALTVANG
jgi:hypothetical protein